MTSVANTFAIIAPTKNPSSRLKITSHAVQRYFRLKGRSTIDARPQAGHSSLRHRHSVRMIVRGSLFMQIQTFTLFSLEVDYLRSFSAKTQSLFLRPILRHA